MAHSDDEGLVLPPKLAQKQIVIVPIWRSDQEKAQVLNFVDGFYKPLKEKFSIILDDRDQYKPGFKFAEWELQGIPLRIEVGPKDVEKNNVVIVRRDIKQKQFISANQIISHVAKELDQMQKDMFDKALDFRNKNTFNIDEYNEFKKLIESESGFMNSHWCGKAECESRIKEETKATIRCIPFKREKENGKCICCGEKSEGRVIFAKAY